MDTRAIVNSNAKSKNVACYATKNARVQEIPTPQGFLVFRICARRARLMRMAAPIVRQLTRINIDVRRVNQTVKKICAASLKERLARRNPTGFERIGSHRFAAARSVRVDSQLRKGCPRGKFVGARA
jgi:hypothetical protein